MNAIYIASASSIVSGLQTELTSVGWALVQALTALILMFLGYRAAMQIYKRIKTLFASESQFDLVSWRRQNEEADQLQSEWDNKYRETKKEFDNRLRSLGAGNYEPAMSSLQHGWDAVRSEVTTVQATAIYNRWYQSLSPDEQEKERTKVIHEDEYGRVLKGSPFGGF